MSTFSVVIPLYNGERFIREAVASVLAQTRSVDELVVYDDGSTDSGPEICTAFGDAIRLVQGNGGPSGFVNGWNKALELASCDYVSILHQDDFLYPDFFSEIDAVIKVNPAIRHLFAVCDYVDESSRKIAVFPDMQQKEVYYSGNAYAKAYQQQFGQFPHIHRCPGVVTHKSVFKQCRYRQEAGHIADDDFFYRVGQYTDVFGLLTPLAAYRIHDASATGGLDDLKLIHRLSKDYLFQVREWAASSFLETPEKEYFNYWALRYLFKALFGALKAGNRMLFDESANDFAALRASFVLDGQQALLRKIRYLLVMKRVLGFDFLRSIVGRYA